MPTSDLRNIPHVVSLVHTFPHKRVLDVGPGWGKYAVLLRETCNDPPERIDCCEAWPLYIERHRLGLLYDAVHRGDVCDLPSDLLATYDLVLMVDVIEHIDKQRALAFLDRCSAHVVIATPVEFFDTPADPPTERHVSHWTPSDFPADRVLSCQRVNDSWLVALAPH